ncbi:MAG: hypothetical protein HY689_12570 [Chloroflexi bacterium]|nr:hypothetical protein [Chloroflexota bacterium]
MTLEVVPDGLTEQDSPTRPHPAAFLRHLVAVQVLGTVGLLAWQGATALARAQRALGKLGKFCATAGWLLGFLMHLYALYVLSQGLLALQWLAPWRPCRRWAARVQYALRELERWGIERFSSTP